TIHKASDAQKIFIVCDNPTDVLALVEGGVPIKKVNIGNMHMADGKRQVATSVAVDDKDVAAFKKLQELGVELEIRRVPDIAAEDVNKLFK
ncbi:PTS sugar transporter subunit IIB, partial [Traorella massiliensis]